MSKFKRGWYVRINDQVFPITGSRQRSRLAHDLQSAGPNCGGPWPITYWDGHQWRDTGRVWTSSNYTMMRLR